MDDILDGKLTAGRLVARRCLLGAGLRREVAAAGRPASDERGLPADDLRSAGHRHVAADGGGAGLAGQADRLEDHRRSGGGAGGLEVLRPSRMGPLQAGLPAPRILQCRHALHDGVRVRGRRQVREPAAGGCLCARSRGVDADARAEHVEIRHALARSSRRHGGTRAAIPARRGGVRERHHSVQHRQEG